MAVSVGISSSSAASTYNEILRQRWCRIWSGSLPQSSSAGLSASGAERQRAVARQTGGVPARKHRNAQKPDHRDPVTRFGDALTESKQRQADEQRRKQRERDEAERLAREAAEHAERVRAAEADLTRAIAAAKAARTDGKGIAEADAEWRSAKARVIELETGTSPDWS